MSGLPRPDDAAVVAEVEGALRIAAASLTEQLAALDGAIEYHEARARELRMTRTRVRKVAEVVHGPRPTGTPADQARLAEQTARRQEHGAAVRAAKKARVAEWVQGRAPTEDITAQVVADALNDPTQPLTSPDRLGMDMAGKLLRELHDEGVVRLDRTAAGGQPYYRLVGQA